MSHFVKAAVYQLPACLSSAVVLLLSLVLCGELLSQMCSPLLSGLSHQ